MPRTSTLHALNAQSVKNAKPTDRLFKLNDGGGLKLWVKPNGSRIWRLHYKLFGREKTYTFGNYPDIPLSSARELAAKARELIRNNIDPVEDRREAEAKSKVGTFTILAEEWFTKQKGRWGEGHAQRVWKSIERDVLPRLGDMPLEKITTKECLAVIRKVESRGALDIAKRTKQRMGACFRYGMATGVCTSNPVEPLDNVVESKSVVHRKMLDASLLPQFLRELYKGERITATTKQALKFIVMTFVRSSELRGMRWGEVDFKAKEWRIPAARMKMKQEHIVPLSEQALKILEEMKPFSGHGELVFPNRDHWDKQMSENTLTYAIRKRMGYDATVHGFRALASTILNEQGWRPDVIERQLAHTERNQVRAAYHRSEYLEERQRMMQSWSDYLDGLRAGAEIIPLHGAKVNTK